MANKPLQSIKFSDLPDTYTIPQSASDLNAIEAPASPSNGDVLTYNSTSGDWEAQAPGGGTADIFWATYNTTTSAEIEAAYQAGKLCGVKYDNRIYFLEYRTSATKHGFRVVDSASQTGIIYSINCISNAWSTSTFTLAKSSDIPSASSATPQALGTAAAGSSSDYSRADHVHAKPSASDVGAVAVAQGVGHAGEFCVVGSDGNITTMTLSTWQGGNY